ncbi:hypothetical protein BC939DRAFT_132873 [Gamsiella multidivaricata]|uniref:uncharacterized protein n=1 Tax=Gamsiella multidivaricata TaxID=101098 RepID=UPI00221FCB46|nr:uncharacterized protein BC939DRAFT_132873 [Gamsiella multidivaricata]KAG0368995.1 hypothetical protein BGZ54_000626 [Gamsiella multidivaricata]KAI7825205.1 hypothetical protein BC939DRAFT_132873 [Gamsiella multidivaricata]
MEGKKDVIRIAYIPNVPEMAHLGGVPQVSFADENYDKHISIASSISTGVLDEAVLMAINKKATPKIMRLNNIKAKNSEMIQKSNNLYSSNSLKRTQSQRRTAEARRLETGAQAEAGRKEEVPETFFTEGQACEGYDAKNRQKEQQQYTPTVMVTAPSTRSSAQSMASGKRKPRPPNMVLEPRPLHPSYHVSPTSSSPAPKSESGHAMPTMMSEPILARGSSTPSTPAPTALVSLLASSPSTSYVASPSSPPPPPASAPASAPVSAPARLVPPPKSYTLDRSDHQAETLEGNGQLDPWIASIMARHFDYMDSEFSGDYGNGGRYATGGRPLAAVRNSTFSTYSDARSTMTRGDGEEIMIFWDGHRGSRASTMYGN